MSNGHKLELLQGEGLVYLNYWDWISGDDMLFEIRNGKAYLADTNTEIDLASALEQLVARIDKEVKGFNND